MYRGGAVMALLFILLVIAGGMGLSVEAGLLGPLAGQVAKSLAIDHYGLFGSPRRKIDPRRAMALMLIMAALLLVALG
ncbi:TPA: DMT family transporter [Klebsiella pneumoniae]